MTIKPLCSLVDNDGIKYSLFSEPIAAKMDILSELFGVLDSADAKMISLNLPQTEIRKLPMSKLKSLSKKYIFIPPKYSRFYPKACGIDEPPKIQKPWTIPGKRKRVTSAPDFDSSHNSSKKWIAGPGQVEALY